MTATINATTGAGGGIVHTSDASGELALQTAGVTALSIDASQNVALTNPLPVASGGSGSTTSTGTGANVLATSPTLVTPNLGTPSAVVLTNATGTANSLNAGIGVNQTWQNVSASRVNGTTYTNSTGKPIIVSIGNYIATSSYVNLTVDGIAVGYATGNSTGGAVGSCVTAVVPNGSTYVLTATVVGGAGITRQFWSELR